MYLTQVTKHLQTRLQIAGFWPMSAEPPVHFNYFYCRYSLQVACTAEGFLQMGLHIAFPCRWNLQMAARYKIQKQSKKWKIEKIIFIFTTCNANDLQQPSSKDHLNGLRNTFKWPFEVILQIETSIMQQYHLQITDQKWDSKGLRKTFGYLGM